MFDGYLFYVVYFCCLVFFAAILTRIVRIKSTPIHLRWELYPVPHEGGTRARYGGSRLEETDWWTKPQRKSLVAEVLAMAKEIVLLKGVFDHNKKLWIGSFPFHFGLYLIVTSVLAIVGMGLFNTFGADITKVTSAALANIVFPALKIISILGNLLLFIGSLVLLARRIFDNDLRLYSSPSHYFNLLAFVALSISGVLWIASDSNFVINAIQFISAQLTLSPVAPVNDIPTSGDIHITVILFLMVYLPFTHMTHFFMKYFTYHSVRWDDASFRTDEKAKAKLSRQLEQPVTWAAPHIMADGHKNWIAIVGEDPTKNAPTKK